MHKKSCCSARKNNNRGLVEGLLYGLVPHSACIAFVLFSILGATSVSSLFKPLLASSSFFYGLIVLSFLFATLSAIFYLKRNSRLYLQGFFISWKYLAVLYGSSIFVNILLFTVVFPLSANIGYSANSSIDLSKLIIKVDIPCTGHAPLIINELKTIIGVKDVYFTSPNIFEIDYSSQETSKDELLNSEIFGEYSPTVIYD